MRGEFWNLRLFEEGSSGDDSAGDPFAAALCMNFIVNKREDIPLLGGVSGAKFFDIVDDAGVVHVSAVSNGSRGIIRAL